MSRFSISLNMVSKSFKRFTHPGWRALDALGCPVPSKFYDVFQALYDTTLEIKRGEKVALIGRNGAGKSTLLRLISGQIKPTNGQIKVNGKLQALMELGTGFHPDFTGIENICSALSYQGIHGKETKKFIEEIIDFTELDEFITRPVREFSAGMYARLAFATATTMTPDILIIDEILGAGDAYFVGKSIQRMKQLTTKGTTVLFVSHDMSASQLLCERGIWLDKGTIKADGNMLSVSKAYLTSIREDEELRIRLRSSNLNKHNLIKVGVSLYRFITVDNKAPAHPLIVAKIKYGCGAHHLGEISIDNLEGASSCVIAEHGATNWSKAEDFGGKICRKFADFGGRFIHAPFQVSWESTQEKCRWLEICYKPSKTDSIAFEIYDEKVKNYVRLAVIEKSQETANWQTINIGLDNQIISGVVRDSKPNNDLQVLSSQDRYGSGPVKVTAFGFLDKHGMRRHTLISGEFAKACISYNAEMATYNPVAVIAIYRPDGTCATQMISSREGMHFNSLLGQGQIFVNFDPLLLGPGEYVVSVALFKELSLASKFEPEAYDLHDRCYQLKILPPLGIEMEIGVVNHPAVWEFVP